MRPLLYIFVFVTASSIGTAQSPNLPDGYRAESVITGLRGPTQMTFGPDGRLYVAQLSGGENAGTGQVVVVDMATGAQEVLLRDLFKPTGVAVTETDLWVLAGDRLLRAPLTDNGVGDLETVLRDLPNNGRSLGTLTLTPDGKLLFETSGALTQSGPQPDSGILWQLDPADPENPEPLATGLKGAYAHTFDADGTLYTTELGDDPMDGSPPPDELNVITPGANYGWPQCYGRRLPAEDSGGTAADCAETQAPLALFARGATPTSVAVSPFRPGGLLVALWVPSQVVQVDAGTGEVTPFLTGVTFPQHLLVDGKALLISSFAEGTVYRITQTTEN